MVITLISDTHGKHKQITKDLPGGDLLVHAGDMSSMGYNQEIKDFCEWFNGLSNYTDKVFIAGNHDWGFIDHILFSLSRVVEIPETTKEILSRYKNFDFLQDEELVLYFDGPNGDRPEDNIRIYGSPWQPEFYNWAFNLPRNGKELEEKWSMIPENTDILITHGPAFGFVDTKKGTTNHLGCELLTERISVVKPKIHVCGHIHSGYGYYFDGVTHFINASVLNERYNYENKPLTVDWNPDTNEMVFL